MIKDNIYIIIFILLFIILFIIIGFLRIYLKKNHTNKEFYNNLSIEMDHIYLNENKLSNKCFIDYNILEKKIKFIKNICKILESNNYLNYTFVILKKNRCLKYVIDNNFKIKKINNKDDLCNKMWREVANNISFKLENNMHKTYVDDKQMLLYKKYFCNINKYFIIGIIIII